MCNDNVIEDETHFIFYCNQYNDLREYLYENIHPKYQHFEILSDAEIINIVMSGVLLNILQKICIKPTTRDVHLSIIKAFVTYNLFHFGAKHIVTFCDK